MNLNEEAGYLFQAAAFQRALDIAGQAGTLFADTPGMAEALTNIRDETHPVRQIFEAGANAGIAAALLTLKEYGLLKEATP